MEKHGSESYLTKAQIRDGNNGAALDGLTQAQRQAVLTNTPLWFYVRREAELNGASSRGWARASSRRPSTGRWRAAGKKALLAPLG